MDDRPRSIPSTPAPAGRPVETVDPAAPPIPWLRCGIGGLLMGLANLVPGVSGGTMILIMGLYDEFISAAADVTRLRFKRRGLLLLGAVVAVAALAIVTLAEPVRNLVVTRPVAMYALFIGMTLGGAPMLWHMIKPVRLGPALALAAGVLMMMGIGVLGSDAHRPTDEERAAVKAALARGEYELQPDPIRDVAAGVLGMSAMVLPGISGGYMLLLLDRYEQILSSISLGMQYVTSLGRSGNPAAFRIILPVAAGVLISLVVVTNVLKRLLNRHERITVAFLLGILLASAVVLFDRVPVHGGADAAVAAGAAAGGLVLTLLLERIGGARRRSPANR